MRQRQLSHPAGTFARCRGCAREPMHIVCMGRTNREGQATPGEAPAERHQLECCRCGHVTARHASLTDAQFEWAGTFGARPPIRAVPRETLRLGKPVAHVG